MTTVRMKHRRKMPDIEIRSAALRKLGFETYSEYLGSPLWQRIRAKVLAARPRCQFCGRPATQVHHRSYTLRVLRGQKPNLLAATCRPCHQEIEFWPDGRKRKPEEVKRRSRELEGRFHRERHRAAVAAQAQGHEMREAMARDADR